MIVISVSWTSTECAKRKVAPEVVNDVNPAIPIANRHRFNPALTRPKMLASILLVMLVIMIPVCFIVYPIFPTPSHLVEKLTPAGLLVIYSALISFLASILFPTAIYSTNEDARTYLKGLIYKVAS